MKFSCDTKSLAKAFQLIAGIVPQRSLKPILTRAKVTVSEKAIIVEGTDLEVAARMSVKPTGVEEGGCTALPAERMAAILSDMTDSEVSVEVERDVAVVRCGDGYYRVLGEGADNFPPVPAFKKGGTKVDGAVLADMMRKTALAVAQERSRYSLNGVYIILDAKKMVMAATDGRRLSVREEKVSSKEDACGIVPIKGISTIRRAVEHAKDVEIAFSDNMIMVKADGTEVCSRLIEGKFPDYTKVIPVGNDKKVELDREEFLSYVKRAALLCAGESRAVKLSFAKGKVKVSARTAEVGEAELSLKAGYDGPAIEIDFNPDYIMDALKALESDSVVLELKDGECAGMMRDGKKFTYVVMPLSA